MPKPTLNHLRLIAPAMLCVVLAACGLFQPAPPATTNQTQQPQLVNLPAPITNPAISSITPAGGAVISPGSSAITVRFAQPVASTASVESAFTLLPSLYVTDLGALKLTLTAMCNGRWRVRNPSASTAVFTWDVYGTTTKGSGIVPGNRDVYFATTLGQKTVRVFVGGSLHNTKAANTTACGGAMPGVPSNLAGSFSWASPSEVTFTPAQALLTAQPYAVFIALEQPFASPFQTASALKLTSANLVGASSLPNNVDGQLLVYGDGITATTSFFIQSNRLEVLEFNVSYAKLKIPAGFLPSDYGLMAANPDGSRSTLYPALTITQAAKPRSIDPQINAQAFVQGFVTNYATGTALPGVRVSLNSLSGSLETTTDASGYYLLRGVPTGKQSFRIEKDGFEAVYRVANLASSSESYTLKLAALEPKSARTTVIGAVGGTHYATDQGASGPYLQIPAGALENDTPIQFTQLRDPTTLPELPQDGSFLAFAHLGPTGLTFKKPATLFLPLQAGISIAIGTRINIFYFDAKRAEWVDDITSGKISNVGGKLYLEYEINHFTWIGGSWNPDAVSGCVRYPNGQAARGVLTNYGVSDGGGYVQGTTTSSDINRTLTFGAINRPGSTTSSVAYAGSGTAVFPCITVPNVPYVPVKWTPEPIEPISPYMPDPGAPPPPPDPVCNGSPAPKPIKTFSERALDAVASAALRPQAEPNTASRLVTADNLYGFTMNIPDWTSGNVDPSSIKLEIGAVDYTGKADFVYPSPTVQGALQIKLALSEPLRAKAGLEVKLGGMTREGVAQGATTTLDVAAKLVATPIQFVKVSSYESIVEDLGAENLSTPISEVIGGAVTVLYTDQDNLTNFQIKIPVLAVDENAVKIAINLPSVEFDTSGWVGATASAGEMRDGQALVPVQLTSNNPNAFKLDVSGVRLGSSLSASGLRVKPQFLFLLIPIEVAVVAVVGVVATTYAIYVNNQRNSGVLPFPQLSPPTFPVCRKPLLTPNIILPAEPTTAPLRDQMPLTLSDLATPTLPCPPGWTPPDQQKLNDLMNEIKITRTLAPLRIKNPTLEAALTSNIFKYTGTATNQVTGLFSNVAQTIAQGLTRIRDRATMLAQKAAYNALNGAVDPLLRPPFPENVGATQHAFELRNILTNLRKRLVQRGVKGPDKGRNVQAESCFSNDDMDFLYALYRLIQDALTEFDKLGPW